MTRLSLASEGLSLVPRLSSELCTALASGLEIILSLRGIARYYSVQQQQTLKARKGSSAAVGGGPTKAAAATLTTAATTTTTTTIHETTNTGSGAKKRPSIFSNFFGGHHHTDTHPNTTTTTSNTTTTTTTEATTRRDSKVGRSGSEGDETNADLMAEMEHDRDQSVIACFDLIFQELRDYQPENDQTITAAELYRLSERKKVKSLAFVHPLVRVFHQSQLKFSLMHDLVLSALPGKSREAAAVKKKEVMMSGSPMKGSSGGGSGGKRRLTMNLHFVTGLFTRGGGGGGGGSDDQQSPMKNKAISSLDEYSEDDTPTSHRNVSTAVERSTSITPGEGTSSSSNAMRVFSNTSEIPLYKAIDGEPYLIITFYELKLFNLFYVDIFGQPKPYFVCQYRDFLTRSAAKVMTSEMETTCWSDETPIQVPIYEVTSSTIEIVIQVYYEGYLTDHCLGQVLLSFLPYDLPAYREKHFELDFNPHSKKVQQAVAKAKSERRDFPSLSLSTNVSKCKRHEGDNL